MIVSKFYPVNDKLFDSVKAIAKSINDNTGLWGAELDGDLAAFFESRLFRRGRFEIGPLCTRAEIEPSPGQGLFDVATDLHILEETQAGTVVLVASSQSEPTEAIYGQTDQLMYSLFAVLRLKAAYMADYGAGGGLDHFILDRFAKIIGPELSRLVIRGSGSGEPTGLYTDSGVTKTAFSSDSLAEVLDRAKVLEDANYAWNAVALSPRTKNAWADKEDGGSHKVFPANMPLILQGRPVISTSAIPTDGGVGENESYCALGDFESLVLAFPRKYRVAVDPRSRFLANDLRVLMALNFGVVIADPSAFEIVSACTE